ncbi:Low temperature requirement protein LtrA [Micromonospora rhizosphaerae]|uniref:Low temperature requirement protein LtrA n=1 Tax=Micromonospora rhizosphaerae TaxID=568872 RepID=A0A1C6RYE6_9ACTN|nr:low temperature requirement protein A [Micromonospora rhizosphaerae]SCL22051.1 Low temperature requirement protein LtrA [Micromonospora rhizosphaerae]
MADQRGEEFLRGKMTSPRATFLELFFDVAFVFALTRVSNRLVQDFTVERRTFLPEAGQTLLLLLALWFVWSLTTWTTSRYNPEQPVLQLVVAGSMFGGMVMAVSLPEAFDTRGLSFALGYVAVQVGRPLVITVVMRHHRERHIARRNLVWAAVSAVPWIAGGLVQDEARGVLWTVAVIIDYGAGRLGWPLPGRGRSPASSWTVTGEHLAERFQQFIIIALGEMILISGFTFSGSEFDGAQWVAFAITFATTALLWRIYFYRAGTVLADAVAASPRPGRLAESATYTHLTMVGGIVASAVGYELVIAHPGGHTDPAWLWVIIGGPALFVLGRTRFEYEVFGRVSRSRLIGLAVLVAIVPLVAGLPPLAVAAATSAVVAGMGLVDALRARGRPEERPAPPM